jgi:hypothetical protein
LEGRVRLDVRREMGLNREVGDVGDVPPLPRGIKLPIGSARGLCLKRRLGRWLVRSSVDDDAGPT